MVVSCCVCPSGITFLELVLQCCNTFEGTALSGLSLYFKALEKRGFPRFLRFCERTSGFWFCCSEVGSNWSQSYGSNLSWKIGVLWSTQRIFRCLGFWLDPYQFQENNKTSLLFRPGFTMYISPPPIAVFTSASTKCCWSSTVQDVKKKRSSESDQISEKWWHSRP